MSSRYARRGPLVLRDGNPAYACLSITGARFKLWRLRRRERAAQLARAPQL